MSSHVRNIIRDFGKRETARLKRAIFRQKNGKLNVWKRKQKRRENNSRRFGDKDRNNFSGIIS